MKISPGSCLLFLCAFLFVTHATARPDIVSLLAKLHSSKADTTRCQLYNDIIRYYKKVDPDTAYYYAKQGLAFAVGIDDPKGNATMLSDLAELQLSSGKFNDAEKNYDTALALFKKIDFLIGIAASDNGMGILNAKRGRYSEATSFFLQALKIYEGYNDKNAIIESYIKLGSVSQETNDLDKALEYFNKGMVLNETNPFSNLTLSLYNDMGIVYAKKGELNKSIAMFESGIAKSKEPQYAEFRIQLLTNAGGIYNMLGKNVEAKICLEEALLIARKGKWLENEANILANLSSLESHTDPKKAVTELLDALSIVQRIGQKRMEMDILDGLVSLYQNSGKYKEALEVTLKKDQLKDSVFNKEKNVEIANLETTYDLEKSNNKIDRLTLLASRNAFRTKLILAITVGVALILGVVVFFYRRTTILNRQLLLQEKELKTLNDITTTQKEELKELNLVKDKIFSVIGHDLRSPLSSIIAMLRLLEREEEGISNEYREFLEKLKFQTLITLDTMDKLLYWGKSSIKGVSLHLQVFSAHPLVRSNIDLLSNAADTKRIKIVDNVSAAVQVYADMSHFDLIIRNLLSNAIKFTPIGGQIEVSCVTDIANGMAVFSVHDNGIGMTEEEQALIFNIDNESKVGTSEEIGTGIGLLLCKEFVQKNGGDMWVSSRRGEGSTFYFSMRMAEFLSGVKQ